MTDSPPACEERVSTRYVLVVCDRSFEKETFGTEDVQVFEALAAHAGVAVERARSVHDLEALAEELEVARDAALAASEAKSLFLANMSHEIRTPLTTVLATAEILEDTLLDDLQLNLVEKMHRSGKLLKTLVEGILDFSRIEAGQLALASTPFDLHAMVADTADVYELRAMRAGTRFEWHLDPCVPRMVVGDPGRLFQVLTNLLDNALKFTHQGQVVRLVVRSAKANVEVGRGVRGPRHRNRHPAGGPSIDLRGLQPGRRLSHSALRGHGLGLAICKQLTELMGGTITVDGQLGVGSTFTVWLPLLAAESAPPSGRDELPAVDRLSADDVRGASAHRWEPESETLSACHRPDSAAGRTAFEHTWSLLGIAGDRPPAHPRSRATSRDSTGPSSDGSPPRV